MALFLRCDKDGCAGEVFAFTALRPEDARSDRFDINDLDRHVSFQVAVEGKIWGQSRLVPTLRIRRWLPGICFFKCVPREEVEKMYSPQINRLGGSHCIGRNSRCKKVDEDVERGNAYNG